MQMAGWEHLSDLSHRIAYPYSKGAVSQDHLKFASCPNEHKEPPASSTWEHTNEDKLIFHSLIESGQKLTRRNPWAASVASLSFQLLLLMTVVVVSLFRSDPLPKAENLTMLYVPPRAAGGAKATKIQAPKPTSKYTPKNVSVPVPVRMKQDASPPPVDATNEVVEGIPGGVGGVPGVTTAVLGGPGSMAMPAKAPEPTPLKRIRVASRIAEANLIHDVPPQYPPEAGRERIEGTVVLRAVIGTDGSVKDVRVESGLPLLAQAAIDAVKQWRYKPYLLNGEAVEIDSRITINFTLAKG
jgi:protein TonB